MHAMHPVRVIYERGITVKLIGSDWHIINLSHGRTEKTDLKAVGSRYQVRPIVVTEIIDEHKNQEIDVLLQSNSPFGLNYPDFWPCGPKTFLKGMNVEYMLQNVEYHCVQLAQSYASICENYSKLNRPRMSEHDRASFGGHPEPYFEFDSLVTTIRSTYDCFRNLLWQYFGTSAYGIPRNFHDTLEKCKEIMPDQLHSRLEASWLDYGKKITSYRDCLIHNAPIAFASGTLHMQKLDNEVWSLNALIPDNPETKSQKMFLYDQQRDVLTYGWDATNEIFEIATIIAETLEKLGLTDEQG